MFVDVHLLAGRAASSHAMLRGPGLRGEQPWARCRPAVHDLLLVRCPCAGACCARR